MTIDAFKMDDLKRLEVQDAQMLGLLVHYDQWLEASLTGHVFTFRRDGLILGVGGVMPVYHGRAIGWTVISTSPDHRDWMMATRKVIRYLDELQTDPAYRRIEAVVLSQFAQGHRWARLLGFEAEAVMRQYDCAGRDCTLYARIR